MLGTQCEANIATKLACLVVGGEGEKGGEEEGRSKFKHKVQDQVGNILQT